MLQPSIILSGRTAQPFNALAAGQAAGQAANDYRYQNDYRRALQQYGAGAMIGDQAAMNALAAFDPAVVQNLAGQRLNMDATRLGMEQTRLGMDATRQQMRYLDQQAAAAVQAAAAQMTEQQRAQQAAAVRSAVASGMAARTPQEWDALMAQSPETQQYIGRFNQREMIAGGFLEIADMLERADNSGQGGERYRPVGGQIWDFQPEGGGQPVLVGGGQQEIIFGPNGEPIVQRGPATEPRTPSERQSTIALFGSMMDATMPVINELEMRYDPSNLQDATAARLGWAGNFMRSEDAQKYAASAAAWAEGVLRLQTGAAATQPEIERVVRTYFAVPGDSPETVAYKRQLREAQFGGVIAASGYTYQPGSMAMPPDPNAAAEPTVNASGPAIEGPMTAQSVAAMSPMQLAEVLATVDLTTLPDDVLEAIIARGE